MEEKLIIFQKSYDFLIYFYPFINRIPKSHRQVLGKVLEQISIEILILIIEANKERDFERRKIQKQLSNKLDYLRILIRLTKDLRFISIKQYTLTTEKLNEIGKMLGGWISVC